MIIAIDGPSASGKGTLARSLAKHMNLAHLDTGRLYRAVGVSLLRNACDPSDEEAALKAALSLDSSQLIEASLNNDESAAAASKVACIQSVREVLLGFQRDFAQKPPCGKQGAVLDGRDVGTIVCPNADIKIYLTANIQVRAKRRCKELLERRENSIYAHVLQDMKDRDDRDTNRTVAPLKLADDAFILDTSELDADQTLSIALAHIEELG